MVSLLEHMETGDVKDYVQKDRDVSTGQRLPWAREAAEGLRRGTHAGSFIAMSCHGNISWMQG